MNAILNTSLSKIAIITMERKFSNIFSNNDVNKIFGDRKCRNKIFVKKRIGVLWGAELYIFK